MFQNVDCYNQQNQGVLGQLEATPTATTRFWLPSIIAIDFFFTHATQIHAVLLVLAPTGPVSTHAIRPTFVIQRI